MLDYHITHQTQPSAYTCVCTCIAMLMDVPAKEVIAEYHDAYYHTGEIDVHDILDENGFIFSREYAGRVGRMLQGGIYILTVASLNVQGGLHQIIVDYIDTTPRVLDPAKGYSGRKYYTFDIDEADDVKEAVHLSSWIIDYTISGRVL